MDTAAKQAQVYRKATCPWGKKAVGLLDQEGIAYSDHPFDSRAEEASFKEEEGVETTPQVFIQGRRIGGYDELVEHLQAQPAQEDEESTLQAYAPVIAVFSTALLMSLASALGVMGFMGFSLCLLACLKLMDLPSFVEGFMQYDLLAPRLPAYAWAYPFLELGVGLALLGSLLLTPVAFLAIAVGLTGGVSIIKAVYIDRQDLDCACVGGNYDVPLGFVSFIENAVMAGMGLAILLGFR